MYIGSSWVELHSLDRCLRSYRVLGTPPGAKGRGKQDRVSVLREVVARTWDHFPVLF